MTRAAFFITLVVAAAATAQQPPELPLPTEAAPKDSKKKDKEKEKASAALPLPGAAPALPLPGAAAAPELPLPAAPKKEAKKQAPAPLALPELDLAAQPTDKKAPLALPGAEAARPAAAQPPAASAQKAAPAVDTKAVTAQKATPVIDRSAMPSKNPPQAEKTASAPSSAGAPYASSMVQLPGDMRLRPDFASNLWTVRAMVGAERSTEQAYTDPVSLSRLGVEATRWFSGTWIARGELDWRTSRQAYVPLHTAAQNSRSVLVDENRFDVAAGVGYDFGPRIAQSGRFELTPMIGVHYLAIRNDAFPTDLIGPEIGGRARWALSSSVILHATLGYTYNLSVASTQNSALKSPVGDFNARAGLALPLSGGYALELDYSGDVLGFQNTYRVAHGAAIAFGTTF